MYLSLYCPLLLCSPPLVEAVVVSTRDILPSLCMALPLLQLGLGFPPAWNARRCLNSRGDGFSVFVALPTSESNVTKIGSGKHVISLSDERNTILGASMLRRIFDPTGVPGVRVADSAQAACLVVVPLHRECCCHATPTRAGVIISLQRSRCHRSAQQPAVTGAPESRFSPLSALLSLRHASRPAERAEQRRDSCRV